MILGLIVVGNNSPSRGGQPAIKQEQKSQGKINGSDSEDIACHSHVLGEGKNTRNFGYKEHIVVKHHFSKFYVGHQWDTKLRSQKFCSPPTHMLDLDEWVLLPEECPWHW